MPTPAEKIMPKTASDYIAKKTIMPTALTSAELEAMDQEILERALFSARTTDASYLAQLQTTLEKVLNPQDGEQLNDLEARAILREKLESLGYQPEAGAFGTLLDLSSDRRLQLVVKTNKQFAQGYAQARAYNQPGALLAYPALELYRQSARQKERPWPQLWTMKGGPDIIGGRMIALKSDPIWARLSRWGRTTPPFDYNSGMWTRQVGRREAIKRGLLSAGETPQPMVIPAFSEGTK